MLQSILIILNNEFMKGGLCLEYLMVKEYMVRWAFKLRFGCSHIIAYWVECSLYLPCDSIERSCLLENKLQASVTLPLSGTICTILWNINLKDWFVHGFLYACMYMYIVYALTPTLQKQYSPIPWNPLKICNCVICNYVCRYKGSITYFNYICILYNCKFKPLWFIRS